MKYAPWAVCLTFLTSPAWGLGTVSLFEGVPAGLGSIRCYDEVTGALVAAPADLANIVLLPIDASGRSAMEEYLPERPRLHADIPGAARLSLSALAGDLYAYRRPQPTGTEAFGYFLVPRGRSARVVLEVQGTGALGQENPFVARVAVSADGQALLAATRPNAGGDLLEASLSTVPAVENRTALLPPLRFGPNGLALTPTFGVGAIGRGVLRFDRTPGAQSQALSFAPETIPTTYTGEIVTSPSGTHCATTAGSGPSALHAWIFGASGNARRASTTAGPLSRAGFLPEYGDGPYLAVADDGQWCAWRTEATGASRECYTAHVPAAGALAPEQLSSDARFLDTLDEVGLFIFRIPGQLIFAVGERNVAANSIESMDLFSVNLSAGAAPAFSNLTLTNGDSTVPFTSVPNLTPVRSFLLPDRGGALIASDDGSSGRIVGVRNGQAPSVLLADVKSLDLIDQSGTRFVLGVERSNGARPEELYALAQDLSSAPFLLDTQANGVLFDRPAARGDAWFGYGVEQPGGQFLRRVDLGLGAPTSWSATPGTYGPALGWSALGSLVFSNGASLGAQDYWVWPLSGAPVHLSATPGTGFVLPGS